MEESDLSAEPPEEFLCPISLDIMTSPVMILTTGKVYDNWSLQNWFRQGGRSCPLTGVKLEFPLKLRPQPALRTVIDEWAAANGLSLPAAVYGTPACISGAFFTKQRCVNKAMQILRGVGRFLISKRPYDARL